MNDRSEKIVNLARAILRFESPAGHSEAAAKMSVPFKALCMATILAAIGGGSVTQLINETRRPINHYEKIELDALVFYAARLKGLNEQNLRHAVENHAGHHDVNDFTASDYRLARTFLQSKIR